MCDRYAFSGVAFSAAKGTLSMDWCKAPDRGLPKPDLVLFLDVSAEVAKTRGGYGEERYEKEEFQARVRKAFETLRAGDAEVHRRQPRSSTGRRCRSLRSRERLGTTSHSSGQDIATRSSGTSSPPSMFPKPCPIRAPTPSVASSALTTFP